MVKTTDQEQTAIEATTPRSERLGERRKKQKREQRLSFTVYGVSLTVLALLIPVLSLVGVRTLINSRDGELVNPVLDPSQPRYQAMVPPSPTLLVFNLDDSNAVVGAALLTLPTFESPGGSVLLVPPLLAGEIPDVGKMPIEAAYAFSGLDAALSASEWALHLGIERALTMHESEWAELLLLSGPLKVFNPDTLYNDQGQVIYPSGDLILEPDDVVQYSAHLDRDESHLNRLVRQELVWEAWLEALSMDPTVLGSFDFGNEETDILSLGSVGVANGSTGADQSNGLPGSDERDTTSLMRRFLAQISTGEHLVTQVPLIVDTGSEPGEVEVAFRLDHEELDRLIPRIIPFPAGYATNTRPLVKVFDGSGNQARIPLVARLAIEVGGQVSMIGNAENFDFTSTEIMYSEETWHSYAQALVEILGYGEIVKLDDMDENSEVIVLIGSDAKP